MVWCLWKRPDAFCLKKCPLPLWGPAGANASTHREKIARMVEPIRRKAQNPLSSVLESGFWALDFSPDSCYLTQGLAAKAGAMDR